VCVPVTVKRPLPPEIAPVEMGVPSPQSIDALKSPGCDRAFWSLNSAMSATSALPAVPLTALPSPVMPTSATVIWPWSVPVWPSGPPPTEIVVAKTPKWAYLWSAVTVYSHRAKSPPKRLATVTGSGAVPSPHSIVPV
jgi:hypothetical protein